MTKVVVLVAGVPTQAQADALIAMPERPIVERRPQRGDGRVVFDCRGGDTLAVAEAAFDCLAAVGLRPVRVLHDDWVTLGDIADRLGRSRESMRLWSIGRFGPGGFPPPVNPGRDVAYFSWFEVSAWLHEKLALQVPGTDPGLVIADLLVRVKALMASAR